MDLRNLVSRLLAEGGSLDVEELDRVIEDFTSGMVGSRDMPFRRIRKGDPAFDDRVGFTKRQGKFAKADLERIRMS